MSSALVVVDVQNDFCEGGSLAVAGGARIGALLADYGYDTVVASRDAQVAASAVVRGRRTRRPSPRRTRGAGSRR